MLNVSIFNGRLCADPELKHTPSGSAVTNFTLAVQRDYAPQGEEKKVDFIDCVIWGKLAETFVRYFRKGARCEVKGRMETRTYTNNDNKKIKVTECNIDSFYFTEAKRNVAESNEFAKDEQFEVINDDGDLPF